MYTTLFTKVTQRLQLEGKDSLLQATRQKIYLTYIKSRLEIFVGLFAGIQSHLNILEQPTVIHNELV